MHHQRTHGLARVLGFVSASILCTPIISLATPAYAAPSPDPAATATPTATARPRLVWNNSTQCMQDPEGRRIRVQCEDQPEAPPQAPTEPTPSDPQGIPPVLSTDLSLPPAKPIACLFAYDCRDRTAPAATCARLERTSYCNDQTYDPEAYRSLVARGVTMGEADAEIQPGWYRDEEGRAFQVIFDLNRRYWLGVAWGLAHNEAHNEDSTHLGRVVLGAGFRVDDLDGDLKGKTRYTFLEGRLAIDPLEVQATLLRFDRSVWGNDPFLRLTTFVGKPRRYDIEAAIGGWGEVGTLEHRPRGSAKDTNLRFGGGGLTWDLWQDPDMTSYFRLRGGVAFEDHFIPDAGRGRLGLTPIAALEGEFTFDDAGFHHLSFQSVFEAPFNESGVGGDDRIQSHLRFTNTLAYELILIAIDDQPVTLRAAVSGGYRDDLADTTLNGWDVTGELGLRFSLWAPARDLAARDEAAKLRARGTK